jgi:hypothetical protein
MSGSSRTGHRLWTERQAGASIGRQKAMGISLRPLLLAAIALGAAHFGAAAALAQGAAAPSGAAPATPQPKTPLPPRDSPRAPQPKTELPPRDAPRAPAPGQQAAKDPDWPCVQRKVSTLSYGQMWAGPPLEEALKTWSDDKEVADLVPALIARRTPMEEAKARIEAFAKNAGDQKNAKLTLLFAGVFDQINAQRSHIVGGIERYAQKQRSLAEKIKQESLKIAEEQKDMASQNTPEAQQQQQALEWDTRIYDERAQSLTYVCESPVILEQRVFDLGREIQNLMN